MMVKLVRAVTAVRATGQLYVSPMGEKDKEPIVVGVRAHISREDCDLLNQLEGEVVMRIEAVRPIIYEDAPRAAAE